MYDSAPPRRYRYLLTWRMRMRPPLDVVAVASQVVGQADVELGGRRLADGAPPRPRPTLVQREGTEGRLEVVGPGQPEELEHLGGASPGIVEHVLVADLQPPVATDLLP